MEWFDNLLSAINSVVWHNWVLYFVLFVGVLFTIWTGFCQYRALAHGTAVTLGKYDEKDDPGAISHFQALSAALSATVGLGNIGGVAVAIALGGPGAVFWMWMIGFAGMALKTTEVTLSMLYRDTSDPDNPRGGPMWVAKKAFAERGKAGLGTVIGGIFCVTLLISTVTGGNMFQAWNVAEASYESFEIPKVATGIILAALVAAVVLGGIKRIGAVAGKLVPFMCLLYLLAAFYVLIMNIGAIPDMIGLIFSAAFNPAEATGAFLGGTSAYALFWGMKRALFSSESGQGSSPIAHCAAKTNEPVREGVVAGLEPFIDTIVVCTLTALVILSTGAWNRDIEGELQQLPPFTEAETDGDAKAWTLGTTPLPDRLEKIKEITGDDWKNGDSVFVVATTGKENPDTDTDLHRLSGRVVIEAGERSIEWGNLESESMPKLRNGGVYKNYGGAALTAHAFDRQTPGLGKWLVVLASWLFAISTMISWSYYGEQGVIYLFGERSILPYKLVYCALIVVATAGILENDADLDALTGLGTGVMLWANIPLMLIFGSIAMKAYKAYGKRLKDGEFDSKEG